MGGSLKPVHGPIGTRSSVLNIWVQQGSRVTSDGGLISARRRSPEPGSALTSRLPCFETERPAEEGNSAALARINRELIGRVEAIVSPQGVLLDMDSTEIPVYGEEEDCLAAQFRPGNVHSAEGWEELRLPEMDRQQRQGKQVVFRSRPGGCPRVASAGGVSRGRSGANKIPGCGRAGRCLRQSPSEPNFRRSSCPEASGAPHSGPGRSGGTEKMMCDMPR